MTKIIGPLHSLTAAGSIADAQTFATANGTPYVKTYSQPSQPNTQAQIGQRTLVSFITKSWSAIPPETRTLWAQLATIYATTPYHAYLAAALRRHARYLAPSQTPNTAATFPGTGPAVTLSGDVFTATFTATAAADPWALEIAYDEGYPNAQHPTTAHVAAPDPWTHDTETNLWTGQLTFFPDPPFLYSIYARIWTTNGAATPWLLTTAP